MSWFLKPGGESNSEPSTSHANQLPVYLKDVANMEMEDEQDHEQRQ
jgi:hypothetical protein